jgi:hypothetical protein
MILIIQELKKSLISILSFLGSVSNGMILSMMFVSHMLLPKYSESYKN